jgi:hypothetical protein
MSETALSPSWNGSVVLDIGGNIGALILQTSTHARGREINLIPDDRSTPPVHSAVRERRTPHASSFAAVYPQLKEGSYTIEGTAQRLTIAGGHVTDVVLDEFDDAYQTPQLLGEHHVFE